MKRYILLFAFIGMAMMATSAPVSRSKASTMAASFLNKSSVVAKILSTSPLFLPS